MEIPSFDSRELDLDLRNENEIFRDHERLDDIDLSDDSLRADREALASEEDGVLYVSLPTYKYDISQNPFLGFGPKTIRVYSIARHLDVMFLHRFIYSDILVQGLRSASYVAVRQRKKFVKHIQQTGGLPVLEGDSRDCDFEALRFAPYVASDTTIPLFERYHKSRKYADIRPHTPVDIWLVHDMSAYERVSKESNNKIAQYRLLEGYDRRSSLLAVAVIN